MFRVHMAGLFLAAIARLCQAHEVAPSWLEWAAPSCTIQRTGDPGLPSATPGLKNRPVC